MIEVRKPARAGVALASIAGVLSCAALAGGRDAGPPGLELRPGQRMQVKSDVAGPGWHRAGIGRMSLPVSGEECTRIAVGAEGGPAGGGGQIHLLTLEAVDSVRVRGADDGRWRTVASDRVRLPEPRC